MAIPVADDDLPLGRWRSPALLLELYVEYEPVVHRYARSRLREADAEDVTADVFRVAAERLRVDPGAHLSRAWLLTVARNRIIDAWRHEGRRRARLHELHTELGRGRDSEPDDDTSQRIRAALDCLTPDQRTALVLCYVCGFRSREIAEWLERSESAVDSLLARGRRAFAVAVTADDAVRAS